VNSNLQSWGIALVRIAVGIIFFAHGAQKVFSYGFDGVASGFTQMGIPLPYPSAVLVALTELLGGIALVLGLGTRIAAILLAIVMLVAMTTVHLRNGFFLPQGYEFTLLLLLSNVGLVLTGSGALALDNLLRKETRSTTTAVATKAA